jgi:hypothetical protein
MREAQMIADEILAERRRQIEAEGFDHQHDDQTKPGDLLRAAFCYVNVSFQRIAWGHAGDAPSQWPWARQWWKPKDNRRDLIRAAALIVAEIERLDRAASRQDGDGFNPVGSGPEPVGPREAMPTATNQAAEALQDR